MQVVTTETYVPWLQQSIDTITEHLATFTVFQQLNLKYWDQLETMLTNQLTELTLAVAAGDIYQGLNDPAYHNAVYRIHSHLSNIQALKVAIRNKQKTLQFNQE